MSKILKYMSELVTFILLNAIYLIEVLYSNFFEYKQKVNYYVLFMYF